jgi:hypothetical protein
MCCHAENGYWSCVHVQLVLVDRVCKENQMKESW